MQPELKVRKILGRTYLNENRLSDALDVFSKILNDYPDDVETLHILGNFYLASGDGKTAKKIYRCAQLINRMGRLDVNPLIVAGSFVETARKVIRAAEKQASALEAQFEGVDPQAQAAEIQELFRSVINELDSFSAKGEAP